MTEENLEQQYKNIQTKISEYSHGRSVELIAVSKGQDFSKIETLYKAGHRDFGENYVQELIKKASEASTKGLTEIRWHMIGALQTNKVKSILGIVYSIHTIDRMRIADEIQKKILTLPLKTIKLPVFIEINTDGEPTKSGIRPDETRAFCLQLSKNCPNLELKGLMCIPAPGKSEAGFKTLNKLAEECGTLTRGELSMGMSDDYLLAIQNGATSIRIGTALFGKRN